MNLLFSFCLFGNWTLVFGLVYVYFYVGWFCVGQFAWGTGPVLSVRYPTGEFLNINQ